MGKWAINIDWNDVPHLSEKDKAELLESIPPFQRDARTKGLPQLGSGLIYPVSESTWVCEPFEIPPYWPRSFGMDVGWNRTAAVWGAWDRETDTIYEYAEYYGAQEPPQIHADAIGARGLWIPGVIDPASMGANQHDGKRFIDEYRRFNLNLTPADNSVEAGLFAVHRRLASGRLKTFRTCVNLLSERRLYRRDEKGKVVKERDHLMDAERYLVMSGMQRAMTEPREHIVEPARGASAVTGY